MEVFVRECAELLYSPSGLPYYTLKRSIIGSVPCLPGSPLFDLAHRFASFLPHPCLTKDALLHWLRAQPKALSGMPTIDWLVEGDLEMAINHNRSSNLGLLIALLGDGGNPQRKALINAELSLKQSSKNLSDDEDKAVMLLLADRCQDLFKEDKLPLDWKSALSLWLRFQEDSFPMDANVFLGPLPSFFKAFANDTGFVDSGWKLLSSMAHSQLFDKVDDEESWCLTSLLLNRMTFVPSDAIFESFKDPLRAVMLANPACKQAYLAAFRKNQLLLDGGVEFPRWFLDWLDYNNNHAKYDDFRKLHLLLSAAKEPDTECLFKAIPLFARVASLTIFHSDSQLLKSVYKEWEDVSKELNVRDVPAVQVSQND